MACDWKRQPNGNWKTSCGGEFYVYKDKTPQEAGVSFCPSCGKPIRTEIKQYFAPCPHCGKSDTLECLTANEIEEHNDNDPDNYAVVCCTSKGGCGSMSGYHRTREQAAEAWNKRHIEPIVTKWRYS